MPLLLHFYHPTLLRHRHPISQCSRFLTKSRYTSSRTLATIRLAPSSKPRPPYPKGSNPPTTPRPRLQKPTTPPPSPPSNAPTRRLLSDALTFLAALGFLSFIWNHVWCIKAVSGDSMYPYLNGEFNTSLERDRVLIDMWEPAKGLRRGMVVAFYSPIDPNRMLVKRIIAVEGDVVITKPPYPLARENVPTGNIWVEGEEESKSRDSNYYGPVPTSLVVGKLVMVVWPWRRMCWTRWQDWRGSSRVLVGEGEVEEIVFY